MDPAGVGENERLALVVAATGNVAEFDELIQQKTGASKFGGTRLFFAGVLGVVAANILSVALLAL